MAEEENTAQPQDNLRKHRRVVPQNELDFNSMMANPIWGKVEEFSPSLQNRVSTYKRILDKQGNSMYNSRGQPLVESSIESDTLSFFSRDFRLGNLDKKTGERAYVEYYIELAHDCLQCGLKKSHAAALARAATKLELSQSDNGFFRKIMNTYREEKINVDKNEPPKRSILGLGKKDNGGN